MDKLKMHTPNKADENFAKLAAMFPNAVTETITGYDENNNPIIERAIDKDVLMQEISTVVVDGAEERYQFTWPDKKKAVLAANSPIAKTLRPCRAESVDFDNTENLYIEGDNLDVLKLLQETYLGKVKMIYIDPPYNTGNDFVYNDDFAENTDDYLDRSGQFDEEGNRLVLNTESNGRFHTDWLNMIYPRLRLAKDLLTDDGVIFISIDDNEIENLKKVCDEVLGISNFIVQFTIASNSSKNNAKYVSITHEYLLCYAKNKDVLPVNWQVSRNSTDEYVKRAMQMVKSGMSQNKIHEELLALTKYPRFYEFDHFTYADKKGVYQTSDLTAPSGKNKYAIIHPITKKNCSCGTRGWAYTEENMQLLINEDRIEFGETEETIPRLKNYLMDNDNLTVLPRSVLFFDSQGSTKWMKSQNFGFDFPKAIEYIKYIISMYPEKEFTVLDFFSGSATTAHAVMQLNAEDGGNRKFIMVQLPEETDEKSEAYKAGYKNICEIGKERIRRAGTKIKETTKDITITHEIKPDTSGGLKIHNKELNIIETVHDKYKGELKINIKDLHPETVDTGFRVLKLDSTNMKDVYYNPDELTIETLMGTVDNIKEDRTPEDLLFQVMLDLGVLLSSKIEQTTIGGKTVYNVADGFLIACFDENVTEETITAIAKMKPYYFVMRDSSMAGDSVAANFDQIFEAYSKDTVRKVM